MNTAEDIRRALVEMGSGNVCSLLGKVVEVNKGARTCSVADGEAIYYDVALQSITEGECGILVVPKIGSIVLMLRIEASDMWSVVKYSEVESVEINDGLNGGLINIVSLISWMNKVKTDLEFIAKVLGGLGVNVVITTDVVDRTKLEDINVKH